MQKQNYREYDQIRNELVRVRECTTHYMGFVLGGSGAAIFGLASFSRDENIIAIAYTSILLSLLIGIILMILFYKFNTHNRYAGYCKLLNLEYFTNPNVIKDTDEIAAWEYCVEQLRQSSQDISLIFSMIDNMKIDNMQKSALKKKTGDLLRKNDYALKPSIGKGFSHLFSFFYRWEKTGSWGFPPYITAVFFVLSLGFTLLGIYHTILIGGSGLDIYKKLFICGPLVAIVLAELKLWFMFFRKLDSLMSLDSSIEGYYTRFIPFRVTYLNMQEIIPKYLP